MHLPENCFRLEQLQEAQLDSTPKTKSPSSTQKEESIDASKCKPLCERTVSESCVLIHIGTQRLFLFQILVSDLVPAVMSVLPKEVDE